MKTPRNRLNLFWSVLAASVLLCPVLGAQSLREELSPQDFERAGLSKLSPEELRALGELVEVKSHKVAAAPAPAAERQAPREPSQSVEPLPALPRGEAAFGGENRSAEIVRRAQNVPDKMVARIKGPFTGWHGNTEFVLQNGQIWRQTEPGDFSVKLDSPEITIRKGFLGTYFLTVEGYNSSVKVRRLK